jgi:hypothetical protein
MKQREVNKKIKAIEDRYHNAANRINDKHTKILEELDNFRIHCIEEIFKLMHQDPELLAWREVWRKNNESQSKGKIR